MPPIGIHFLANFGALAALTRVMRKRWAGPRLAALSFGVMLGGVLPDADLVLSSLSYLFTFSTEPGKLIHRTLTHSVFGIAPVLLVGLLGLYMWKGKRERTGEGGDTEEVGFGNRRYLFTFFCALALGMSIHVFLDLFYLVGVKLLFPVSMKEFFIGPFRKERLSTALNNVINGIDFITDTLYFAVVYYLAAKQGTDTRRKRYLPYLVVLNLLVFIPLTLKFFSESTYDDFLVILYIPGIVFIIASTLAVPFLFRNTFEVFGFRGRVK